MKSRIAVLGENGSTAGGVSDDARRLLKSVLMRMLPQRSSHKRVVSHVHLDWNNGKVRSNDLRLPPIRDSKPRGAEG